MKYHSRSIYGCTQAPDGIAAQQNCLITYNAASGRMYIHVLEWPPVGSLRLTGFSGRFKYAQLLSDGSEVRFRNEDANDVVLTLPVLRPNVEVPVIELFLEQ
jgi:alpha-L-fucosidase